MNNTIPSTDLGPPYPATLLRARVFYVRSEAPDADTKAYAPSQPVYHGTARLLARDVRLFQPMPFVAQAGARTLLLDGYIVDWAGEQPFNPGDAVTVTFFAFRAQEAA